MNETKVKLLDARAELPKRAHDTDTGYDIKLIAMDKVVGDVIYFKTGLSIKPPAGFYYDILPRSSISKLPLMLANSVGVIDESYRGEIIIPVRVLHAEQGRSRGKERHPNGLVSIFGRKVSDIYQVADSILNTKPVLFQMVLKRRLDSKFIVADSLDETQRGTGGFGSTDG